MQLLSSIEQGSEAWHKFRSEGIGSSDAAIIMGLGYITPTQLWRQRLGLDKPQETNFAMMRGHELEPIARAEFISLMGIHFEPCLQINPENPVLRCSLDGMSLDGTMIVEIKCVNKQRHETARRGEIPDEFYPQVQHQLAVTGLDKAFYFSYKQNDSILLEIKRDDDYIQRLIVEEKRFWVCLQDLIPPDLNKNEETSIAVTAQYKKRDDEEWRTAARRWKDATDQLKHYEMIAEQAKQNLIALACQSNSWGDGIKLSKCMRKGNVDYKKIMQDYNIIDEESYRKPESEYFRITEV